MAPIRWFRAHVAYILQVIVHWIMVDDAEGEEESIFGEPEVRSVIVMSRSDDAFYYNLTDEDFCEWARTWAPGPQVLSAEDRDDIMERLRAHSPAWGYMEV